MRRFATLLAALLLVVGPDALAQSSRVHDTGTAALRVFNNGYFGGIVGAPTDTTFNFGGGSPLYEGQLLVAVSPSQVSGQPYSASPQGPTPGQSEWTVGTGPTPITAPAPFNVAYEATYTDAGTSNTNPANLSVRQRSYSRAGDDFVVVEVQITNTGTAARTGVYIGMFADFDVSATAVADVGGFDPMTQSVYTRNNGTTGNQNVYGVTLLGMAASGWNVSTATQDATGLYQALTERGTPGTPPADRRNTIGAGPFTIAAGGSQTVRFAYVGGTNLADFQTNAAAARALYPVAVTSADITTSTITSRIYNNGIIGDNCISPGFIFNGREELCGAGFLLGFSPSNVIGDTYLTTTATGWTPLGPPMPSSTFPIAGLTQGTKVVFANMADNVVVELNAYSGANPDFFVFRYDITNSGSAALPAGYPGIFADWDVGGPAYASNLGAVNPSTATMYAWDPTGASPNYVGVSSLRYPLSGWRYDMPYPPHSDEAFYSGLTVPGPLTGDASNGDQRHVLGTGPFTIAAGARRTVDFAFVAGSSESDFQSNVAAARGFVVAGEAPAPGAAATALSAPRPNPTTGWAELSLTVEQSQAVRVSVYDALGREVLVLHDAPVAAGAALPLRLDSRPLPAGLYVVRAVGDTFQATQRVIVSH